MKKRLIALLLCICMVGSMTVYAVGDDTQTADDAIISEVGNVFSATAETVQAEPDTTLYEDMMAAESVADMYAALTADEAAANALTGDEIDAILARVDELDPEGDDADTDALVDLLLNLPNFTSGAEADGEEGVTMANNVYNETKGTWHTTLTEAVNNAATNNVIIVYKDTTETYSFGISPNENRVITIKAADGVDVTVTWNKVNAQGAEWYQANGYSCIYVHSGKLIFGEKGATGSLTLKHTNKPTIYSSTNKNDLIGKQPDWNTQSARVIMLNGGNMDLHDGVTITGGHPVGSGVPNMAGGGILVGSGSTLNMDGGTITKNYSLGGTADNTNVGDGNGNDLFRCCIGAGGGVYVRDGGTFNLSGGVISENTSDNGGGGGVAVAPGSTFNMTGGKIKNNVIETSSGGGFASVNGQNTVKISGGEISGNTCPNAGGGVFARGGAVLEITGDVKIFDNEARIGGGVLYWTTGEGNDNKLVISGDVEIYENRANQGAGVYIGREYYHGQIIGKECYFEMKGGKIYKNTARTDVNGVVSGFGGGIYAQDNCNVTITGGTIEENHAKDAGGGVYVFSGNIEMSAGTIKNNTSYDGGAFM